MSSDELRQKLDLLDEQIVRLLNDRARVTTDIARANPRNEEGGGVEPDAETETVRQLLEKQKALSGAPIPAESLVPVFREIVSACRAAQHRLKVAYLGPAGSFCQTAAQRSFGHSVDYDDCTTIARIFELVERGEVDFGVAPIENSVGGSVSLTLDNLIERQVQIRQELVLEVNQCLIARHKEYTRIERVHSHPQGLAQCRRWLAEHLPRAEQVVTPSTSAAVRDAAEDDRIGAIASSLAAEINGLLIVQSRIQDEPDNATRFVILGQTDARATGNDQTSLVFATAHERGALRRVLEVFDQEGINLNRIESRPGRSKLWEYVFFTDLEGHRTDIGVERALKRLSQLCRMVKVLGSYPCAHW